MEPHFLADYVTLAEEDRVRVLRRKQTRPRLRYDPPGSAEVTVALTAYDDEASIGDAVRKGK